MEWEKGFGCDCRRQSAQARRRRQSLTLSIYNNSTQKMSFKSKLAFDLSVERLAECGRMFLWTFTFAEVLDHAESFKRWNRLNVALSRTMKKHSAPALRVCEVHPGETWPDGTVVGHGLHFHVLFVGFVPVQMMRRVATRCGFGRIHVDPDPITADRAKYCGKYLGKREFKVKGRRMWAAIRGFDNVKCKDLRAEGEHVEIYRQAARLAPRDRRGRINIRACAQIGDDALKAGESSKAVRSRADARDVARRIAVACMFANQSERIIKAEAAAERLWSAPRWGMNRLQRCYRGEEMEWAHAIDAGLVLVEGEGGEGWKWSEKPDWPD